MTHLRRAAALMVGFALLGSVAAGCRSGSGTPADNGAAAPAGGGSGDNGPGSAGTAVPGGSNGPADPGGADGPGNATTPGDPPADPADATPGAGGSTDPAGSPPASGDSGGQARSTPPGPPPPRPSGPPQLPGVLWVMVENSPGARPQSGLDLADWVYEIEAEGGITRFMAGYYSRAAAQIGPIRSVRFYFLHLLKAYGGPIAHAGGNADALDMLARDRSYQDMDEIYNAGSWFWRSRDRKAPHNLYTSTELLLKGAKARKYTFRPLPEQTAGEAPGGGDPAVRVGIDFPLNYVKVEWRWADGRYVRWMNGKVHAMQDGALVYADNVLVVAATHYRTEKSAVAQYEEYQRNIGILGEGEAWFFSGGRMWSGRWRKAAAGNHMEFLLDGEPFPLAPGITWVAVVPDKKNLTYKAG